jgi:nucleotide-binding universal stress UspA family protein
MDPSGPGSASPGGAPSFRLERIVLAFDFDAVTAPAIDCAVRLAARTDARLYLLHALELGARDASPETAPEVEKASELFDLADDRIQRRLSELRGEEAAGDFPTVECLRFGRPAEEVAAFAEEVGASLIVTGTHARAGVGRVLVGSVAEEIWRRAPCPVLVTHEGGASSPGPVAFHRVLVAFDGSRPATAALTVAALLAARDAEIDVVRVLERGVPGEASPSLETLERERARLQAALETVTLPGSARPRVIVQRGKAAAALAHRASGTRYDLVACGTRGHGGLARFLETSVARSLSKRAPNLLVVRDGSSATRFGFALPDEER